MAKERESVSLFSLGASKEGEPDGIPNATYQEIGASERYDIQRWIKKNPALLGEEILIVAEEMSNWDKGSDRIDLVGIDRRGKLVVIELKLDKTAQHPDLQALRYASYASTLDSDDVSEMYADFLKKENDEDISASDALERLAEFVTDSPDLDLDDNEQPRMILAASGFRPGVLSTVIWLRKSDLDIGCVQIQPFKVNGEIVLTSTTLIPLPEATDYEVKMQSKRRTAASKKQNRLDKEAAMAYIDSIPKGCWTSYGDVAEAGGTPKAPMGIGSWLRHEEQDIPLVYRVLNYNGAVNDGWVAESEQLPQTVDDVRAKLVEEGVSFDGDKASQADRWRPIDWEKLKAATEDGLDQSKDQAAGLG